MAKLIRQDDGLVKEGVIEFIEFGENGRGKNLHSTPKKGFSCVVDAKRGMFYTWLTSTITEVISDTEFKTKNSHYKIEQ